MIRLTALVAFGFLCLSTPVMASLIAATASPKHTKVNPGEGRTIKIRWVISTDSAHKEGAYSAQAELTDSITGSVIKTITSPLDKQEGAGPLHFEETLTITADEIRKWRDLGYRELTLKRIFSTTTESPSNAETKISISIDPANATPSWVLHDLQLQFKPQRFKPVIRQNATLHVQARIGYSGQGKLQGRWLVAKINDNTDTLTYQQLAQTQRLLSKSKEMFILSPKLPTQQKGKYIARFCVIADSVSTGGEQAAIDTLCPKPEFIASLEYEVTPEHIETTTSEPQEPATLSEDMRISWKAVQHAVVYELRIYQTAITETATSSKFHNRMLISGHQTGTQLSSDIIATLSPGTQYNWSIAAYDQHGELIQQSAPVPFLYSSKQAK